MKIEIRQETNADIKDVYALNKSAFLEENEAKLVDMLRSNDAFIPELSLVAISGNEIIGHILFTEIKIYGDGANTTRSIALAPMAVKPEFQKRGVGTKLIAAGLQRAAELGYGSVIVVGHERYYPRFGFVPAEKWNIRCPFDVPPNVFMALELVQDGLKNAVGQVEYAKPFYEV
jgi:putative acetyltransferase